MYRINPHVLTPDMQRIINIPKTPDNDWWGWPVFDSLYKCGNAEDSKFELNKIQRIGLSKLINTGGLLAMLPVGWGKTLLGLLAPTVVKATRPLYLTRAKNIQTTKDELVKFYPHFNIQNNIEFYSYEGNLSRAEFAHILTNKKPDLIIADEGHCLRHLTSARTKRFVRYFQWAEEANHSVKLVVMSGTLSIRSIKDYEHLSRICLRENSPLPFDSEELQQWATVLDAHMDAGLSATNALVPLVPSEQFKSFAQAFGSDTTAGLQTNLREVFQRRLRTNPGIVSTSESSVSCSLNLHLWRQCGVDSEVVKHLNELDEHPDHYGLLPPTEVMGPESYADYISNFKIEKANQLMHGFYYQWDWPGGQPDMEYVDARSRWAQVLSDELHSNHRAGYDSPALVVKSIEEGRNSNQDLIDAWGRWKVQSQKPEPPKKVVWISDYLIDLILQWNVKHSGSERIIWVDYDVFGVELAKALTVDYYGAGSSVPVDSPAIASRRAHGTGQNLQTYSCNLVVSSTLNGAEWEQLLGRTHRQGQKEDEVSAHILLHTDRYKRKWLDALAEAKYLQESLGQKQKILYATHIKEKGVFPNSS